MRVPRYRPISKAELGKRGLIYGTGSRAKRPHRLTVLLAAQQNVFIRQAICNVQAPAEPGAPLPALSFFGGFRTTAPVLVASSEMGRHPKPVTKTAANFRDRHGRTCLNTGRQGTATRCAPSD